MTALHKIKSVQLNIIYFLKKNRDFSDDNKKNPWIQKDIFFNYTNILSVKILCDINVIDFKSKTNGEI